MACLYCGKRVSMVRQMADPDFCSDEHRRRYGDMARAALSRLMDLDAAEAPESPGRRPAVPGPALVERPASAEPRRPAARRDAQGERRAPRLAAAPVTPAERGILSLEPAACGTPASLLFYAEYEFAPAAMRINEPGVPAVSFTPRAFEELMALPQRLNAHGMFRSCDGIGMPEGEVTLPAWRGVSDRAFAGHASAYGFRRVEGRARRRFARPRTTAAPKFSAASIGLPNRTWGLEPLGLATAPRAPQPPRTFVPSAAKPVPADPAVPAPAVLVPQTHVRPASGLPGGDAFAAIEARCDLGFRAMAPAARKGVVSAILADSGLPAREAAVPDRSLPGRAPARMAVCAALPLQPIAPATGPRAMAACADHPQPAAQFRIAALPSVSLSLKLRAMALFPIAAPPASNRVVRAAAGVAGAFTVVSAGGAGQPVRRLARPAELRGALDAFGLLPRAPRPVNRPAAARECSPGEAAGPAVHIPAAGKLLRRDAVLACATWGVPWAPKPRAVASEFRLQPDQLTLDPVMPAALPSSRCRRAVREIRAGYFNPEPPGPHGGERKPRPAALDFGDEPETPARRGPDRLGIGANIASASAAPSAAPHACAAAPAVRCDSAAFVEHPPHFGLRSAAPFRHEIPAAGAAPPRIAPAWRAVMPAPASVGAVSCPALLPRTGQFRPGAPAGIQALPLRDPSSKPARSAAVFRQEPAFAPELPPAEVGMPAPAPIAPLSRTLNAPGFQPAGAAPILKTASQAHIEQAREFRTAIPLPKREARIRAAFRIGSGLEIRLLLGAPRVAGMPFLAEAAVAIPHILLPAGPGGGPRLNPSVAPAPVSPVPPGRGDRAGTRTPLAAAAALQSGGGPLRTMHIAVPGPVGGAAAPRMAGLKTAAGLRPALRADAARTEITAGAPAGTVVLPARRTGLPRPGYPAAGFARFECAEYDEIRNAVTRPSEAPLPQPVLPRYPAPDPVLVRTLCVPGMLNGYPRSHAGMCLAAEAGPLFTAEIAPAIIPFEATPDVDDGQEALAPAVPDDFKPRQVRRTGSRLFR